MVTTIGYDENVLRGWGDMFYLLLYGMSPDGQMTGPDKIGSPFPSIADAIAKARELSVNSFSFGKAAGFKVIDAKGNVAHQGTL